jgi:hypothetical protein
MVWWYLWLVIGTAVAAHLLGVQPRSEREWHYVRITLGFLTWLMLGLASVR